MSSLEKYNSISSFELIKHGLDSRNIKYEVDIEKSGIIKLSVIDSRWLEFDVNGNFLDIGLC